MLETAFLSRRHLQNRPRGRRNWALGCLDKWPGHLITSRENAVDQPGGGLLKIRGGEGRLSN